MKQRDYSKLLYNKKTQVTKTYLPSIDKFKQYVDEIFQSGHITNNGPLVQRLETRLQDFLGVKHLVLTSSGTAALQVAYKILDLQDQVITTPFSFVASVSSLVASNLSPQFADIDEKTFNIDPQQIVARLTSKTSAIVPVHVFGNACDIDTIQRIGKDYGLKIIYDAAHAFGVHYNGKSILEFGEISTLSFHATKIFHTIEGGALVTDDAGLAEKARCFRNFGIEGPESIQSLGINAKMNEFEAAMGLCILDDLPEIMKGRERVFEHYRSGLEGSVELQKTSRQSTKNYSHFPVVFENEAILQRVQTALHAIDVIPRRYFYPSLDTMGYIAPSQHMPRSRKLSKRILCLPMHDKLSPEMQDKIIETIKSSI